MSGSEKEIQKTLAEMNQRVAAFQSGGNIQPTSDLTGFSFSSPKIKLGLAVMAVLAATILCGFVIYRSGHEMKKAKLSPQEENMLLQKVPGYKTTAN